MDKVKQNIIQQQQLDKFNIEKSVVGTEAYYINQDIQKGISQDEIIEKARSGVYKLTAENKKAGRVGQKYGAEHSEKPGYSQKEHGEEEFEGQRGPGEDKWNKKESTDKKEHGKTNLSEMAQGKKSSLPKHIEKFLSKFPDDAKSWGQATDEIRDLARSAKETYNDIDLDVSNDDSKALQPLNFKEIKTPSEWNTKGKQYIRDTYNKMSPQAKQYFEDNHKEWFK